MRRLAIPLFSLLLASTIVLIGCGGEQEYTPTPTPTAEPRPGVVTLKISIEYGTLALSEQLPFAPVSKLKRIFRVIQQDDSYSFTQLEPFYLRNTGDTPVEFSFDRGYGSGRLQQKETVVGSYSYERFVAFTYFVGDTRVVLGYGDPIAPGETLEIHLQPIGSKELLQQYYNKYRHYPSIDEFWEAIRLGWEDALGTAVTDARWVPGGGSTID